MNKHYTVTEGLSYVAPRPAYSSAGCSPSIARLRLTVGAAGSHLAGKRLGSKMKSIERETVPACLWLGSAAP